MIPKVRAICYPEVQELLKRQTGTVKVVIFDHVVRNADKAKAQGRWQAGALQPQPLAVPDVIAREYARAAHND